MKKIFVTVADFLDNDGALNERRQIFDSDGHMMGEFRGFNGINMPLVGIYSQPYSIHEIYVEIDCTPHYI